MPIDLSKVDAFTRAYIECALWSSYSEEVNLNDDYGIDDISLETFERMVLDCAKFQEENAALINGAKPGHRNLTGRDEIEARAGHDFWLTRCGHGAGFWDGDWPINGDALTKAARAYGNIDLYVGDDGKIYG